MEETLKKVNKRLVQLDENEIHTNNLILREMLDEFLIEFKTDALFKSIFKDYFFGGSFYDGLKVGEPNEFDIDFVLDFPQNAKVKVIGDVKNPEYAKVCLEQSSVSEMKRFVDVNGCLTISKIMSWFQGIVDKGKAKMIGKKGKKYEVVSSKAPAVTIRVTVNKTIFDVDFVPCFKFGLDHWPSTCRRYSEKEAKLKEFFLVPKPKTDRDDFFRLSFPEQERDFIHNCGNLKPAIRLIKLVRDIYNDKIKSYYIKNLAMVAVEEKAINVSNGNLSEVFKELFNYYVKAVVDGKLPYFWNKNLNLLEGKTGQHYTDLINRLRLFQGVFQSEDETKIMQLFKIN